MTLTEDIIHILAQAMGWIILVFGSIRAIILFVKIFTCQGSDANNSVKK